VLVGDRGGDMAAINTQSTLRANACSGRCRALAACRPILSLALACHHLGLSSFGPPCWPVQIVVDVGVSALSSGQAVMCTVFYHGKILVKMN
jgi:hypothetical protein